MKKYYLFMLMAVGLLVSTSMWAQATPKDETRLPEPLRPILTELPSYKNGALKAPIRKAAAEVMVAQIGETKYPTVQAAFDAVPTDGTETTVKLLDNANEPDNVFVYGGRNIKLDLQGHTLNFTTAQTCIWVKVYYDEEDQGLYIANTDDKLTVLNGTLKTTYNGFYNYGTTVLTDVTIDDGNYAIQNCGGTLTLNDVDVWYVYNTANLNYNSGIMRGYLYQNGGTVNMTGGSINVSPLMYAGTFNMSGGVINGNAWYGCYVNGCNLNISGDAQIIDNVAGSYAIYDISGSGFVTISGNAFIQAPIALYSKRTITITENPTIDGVWSLYTGTSYVYGGTFKYQTLVSGGSLFVYGGYYDCKTIASDGTEYKPILSYCGATLYGGKFNSNTFVDKFCKLADGYDFAANGDGTYTVRKKIAQIAGSDVNYFSLQDAIDAAGNDDVTEISLLANDTVANVTISGKEITFDANGKTFVGNMTATDGAVLNIVSTGTIKGSLIQNGGTIKVYTGNFTNDPTPFVPEGEGCTVTGPTSGIYTVSQVVAQIDETPYTSFAAAIAAANEMTDPTVTLLANARLTSDALNVNKSMTIDLNGHSLSSVNTKTSYLRFGTTNTEVTIKNGTITNAATATQFSESLVSLSANNQVTLDNVTINHKAKAAVTLTLLTETAKLIVNSNCTLNGKEYGVYMGNGILENNATSVIVGVGDNDAEITNNAGASMTLVANGVNTKTLTLANQGSLEITDGIFAGTINVTGTIAISGGVFYDAVKTTVESYKVAEKNWNQIVYKGQPAWDLHSDSETVIATIDGLKYYSLEDAIRAIAADKNEKTIILQNNVNISDFTRDNQYNIAANQYVKIDLNGKNVIAVNETHTPNAILFNIEAKGQLTIDDSSTEDLAQAGKITYQNNCSAAGLVYTANCNGTLILNNGTFENTTKIGVGTVGYTVEIGKGGVLTIKGGLLSNQYQYAVRYWADSQTNTQMNVNGGEIKAPRPIWTQLAGSNSDASPYVNFNMTGGKLTCTTEGGEAFYVYSFGQSLGNIKINVTGGIINGHFSIGGGSSNGGHGNENITINGGTFESSNSFKSYKRGVENNTIFGGAFFFDADATTNDYIRFCEYIGKGHYAVKMCRDDANGKYSSDKFEGKYNLCEGDACEDGTFWAIIDGEGTKDPQDVDKNGQWSDDPNKGVFNEGKTPDIHTDVNISGDTVEIMSGVDAEANRVVIEEGSGIIVHDGATLNVGTGGIEVNGDGKGTTFILVEAGGTVVANGTVISQNVDEIRVEANASGVGTVLLEPSLDYNNQPMSTVEMYTYARYIPEQDKYIWQHFGIPTLTAPDTIFNNRNCASQFWQWNYELGDWEQVKYKQKQVNTPFRGYNLKTNHVGEDGVIYTFTGKILGNGDASFDLKPGFNFYANSYLAPINASTLIDEIQDDNVEWTVWMYDGKKDNFDMINEISLLFGEDSEIPALRGFFLKLTTGSGVSSGINYESTVWQNAISKAGGKKAPAKNTVAADMSLIQISLVDNQGKGDKMYLAQSNQFDALFDNGFDASKQMSEESANLYAQTIAGDLAIVATDNLDGLYLSMNTKSENVYTMTFSHQSGEVFELVDLYEGQTVKMTEGATYTFVAQENSEFSNRFQIRKTYKAPTDNELIQSDNKTNKGIYTPLGQYLGNANEWSVLPAGVYVIDGQKVVK